MTFIAVAAMVFSRGESLTNHTNQMKLINAIAAAAVCGTFLFATKRAEAKPFIYVDSYSYSGTAEQCLKNARIVLNKLAFDNFYIDDSLKKERKLSISGYHKDEYLSVEIECDQKMGVTSLGVSGLDHELTFDMYEKLYKSKW